MKRELVEILKKRRSRYELSPEVGELSVDDVVTIIKEAVKYLPSAFNSQSTRIVLLTGDSHRWFWDKVCSKIAAIVPAETFEKSRNKIWKSFASGFGTLLFFEDESIVDKLKNDFPMYAGDIPIYSEQASAMHQIVLWLMFADEGIGASLQHYSPLIEDDVRSNFSLPETWKLIAQMPFGTPLDTPPEKTFVDIDSRVKIFY